MYRITFYDNYGFGCIECDTFDEAQKTMHNLKNDDYVSGVSCSYIDDESGEWW